MSIDTWVAGYKVRGFDWIDGKNFYLHIEHYLPGASLSQPPAEEKSVLIPLEEAWKVKEYLHSVVTGMMRGAVTA